MMKAGFRLLLLPLVCLLLQPDFVLADSLRQVVQHTVLSNPEVLRTTKVARASNETVRIARSRYFPVLDFHAGVGRERSENRITESTNSGATTLWRQQVGASLRENLFEGFTTLYEMKRTRAKTDADAYAVCAEAESAAMMATMAYLHVLQNQALVQTAKANLDTHRRILTMVKQRGKSGIGRKADIHQAEGRLALAKSDLYSYQNDLRNSYANYFAITGLDPNNLIKPQLPTGQFIPNTEYEGIMNALKYHPKMRLAVVDVEEARAQHNVTYATAFPIVDLVFEANHDRDINGIRGKDYNYAALLELHYNLFRGGADVAHQSETAYYTQEAGEIRNRTCREVMENFKLAWNAMNTTNRRLSTLDDHKVAAIETAKAYHDQFKLGKRSLLDLLDAEVEKFNSQSNYIRGEYDQILARYRVIDAQGQLANYLNVTLPKEARSLYDTYEVVASPAVHDRQYDAGIEQRDVPARWYKKQQPIQPHYHDMNGLSRYKQDDRLLKKPSPQYETKAPWRAVKRDENLTEKPTFVARNATKTNGITQSFKPPHYMPNAFAFDRNGVLNPLPGITDFNQYDPKQFAPRVRAPYAANDYHHFRPRYRSSYPVQNQRVVANRSGNFAQRNQPRNFRRSSFRRIETQHIQPEQRLSRRAKITPQINRHETLAQARVQPQNQAMAQRVNKTQDDAFESERQADVQSSTIATGKNVSPSLQSKTFTQPARKNVKVSSQKPVQRSFPQQSKRYQNSRENEVASYTPRESIKHFKPSPTKPTHWAVNLGKFTADKDATDVVTRLKNNGFSGFVKETTLDNGTKTIEVFAGPANQRSEIEQLHTKLKRFSFDGEVVETSSIPPGA